jgi:hypothetical protein
LPRHSPPLRLALALAALAMGLAGCTLVDRRTFEGRARTPSPDDVVRAKLPPLPFVTIPMDDPDADFRPALADAVEAAQARKPDVDFDVLAPIPTNATQDVRARFEQNGEQDTQTVATALGYDGVSMDHVHVGFRGDPGNPPREVRIYLR